MNICVYGASGDRLNRAYFGAAERLGALIGQGGHSLIFGGGQNGLMGACARGVSREKGKITGIAPRFFDEPGILYPHCTEFIFTETMGQRKAAMEDAAQAFIVLPGGIGTYEEFFETLTLKQLGRHAKPIAVLNTAGYYDAMAHMLRQTAEQGFMSKSCLQLFALCDTPEQALDHVLHDKPLSGSIKRLSDYNA